MVIVRGVSVIAVVNFVVVNDVVVTVILVNKFFDDVIGVEEIFMVEIVDVKFVKLIFEDNVAVVIFLVFSVNKVVIVIIVVAVMLVEILVFVVEE